MCCHGQDGASETPGSLLKHSWLDPTRVPDSVGLEWGPDICISSETPGDTDALTPGSRGRDHCLGEMVKLAKIRSLLLRTEKKKKASTGFAFSTLFWVKRISFLCSKVPIAAAISYLGQAYGIWGCDSLSVKPLPTACHSVLLALRLQCNPYSEW